MSKIIPINNYLIILKYTQQQFRWFDDISHLQYIAFAETPKSNFSQKINENSKTPFKVKAMAITNGVMNTELPKPQPRFV